MRASRCVGDNPIEGEVYVGRRSRVRAVFPGRRAARPRLRLDVQVHRSRRNVCVRDRRPARPVECVDEPARGPLDAERVPLRQVHRGGALHLGVIRPVVERAVRRLAVRAVVLGEVDLRGPRVALRPQQDRVRDPEARSELEPHQILAVGLGERRGRADAAGHIGARPGVPRVVARILVGRDHELPAGHRHVRRIEETAGIAAGRAPVRRPLRVEGVPGEIVGEHLAPAGYVAHRHRNTGGRRGQLGGIGAPPARALGGAAHCGGAVALAVADYRVPGGAAGGKRGQSAGQQAGQDEEEQRRRSYASHASEIDTERGQSSKPSLRRRTC